MNGTVLASIPFTTVLLLLGLTHGATEHHSSLINGSWHGANEGRWGDKDRNTITARPKDPLVVQTRSGLVRGTRRAVLDTHVDVFLGIPFATPPIGPLRFKLPLQVEPWLGVLDATELPKTCYQEPYNYFPGFKGEEMWNPNTELSEDCLYLNLWVPAKVRAGQEGKAPVVLWLYGGGFMGGTSTLEVYDADLMAASTNMIVVSIQYRVGAFGYMYLDISEAPGNMGMYDQALAMKWVKDNAQFFGGDPDRITLFGESAGASSAALHLLSPVSKHLFSRAVLQSGVPNNPWAIMTSDKAYDIALKLVDDLKCNATLVQEDPQGVMECMLEVEAAQISSLQWNSYLGILQFPSTPIVDGAFLPRDPLDMIREGDCKKTQVLLGSNGDEGTFFIVYDFMSYFKRDSKTFLERHQFLEIVNEIFKSFSPIEREAIVFQYTNWDDLDDGFKNQQAIAELVADYFFICPTNLFAHLYAEHCHHVYYYFFDHRTSINPWGEWMGVLHADEIDYVFGLPLNKSNGYTDSEAELSQRIMDYYRNFAANGRPVNDDIEWPLYDRSHPQYFVWNEEEQPPLGKGPRATACAFWNDLMPKLKEKQGGGVCESEMQKALNGGGVVAPGLMPLLLLLLLPCIGFMHLDPTHSM